MLDDRVTMSWKWYAYLYTSRWRRYLKTKQTKLKGITYKHRLIRKFWNLIKYHFISRSKLRTQSPWTEDLIFFEKIWSFHLFESHRQLPNLKFTSYGYTKFYFRKNYVECVNMKCETLICYKTENLAYELMKKHWLFRSFKVWVLTCDTSMCISKIAKNKFSSDVYEDRAEKNLNFCMSMLMSHALVDFYVLSFVLPFGYADVASEHLVYNHHWMLVF